MCLEDNSKINLPVIDRDDTYDTSFITNGSNSSLVDVRLPHQVNAEGFLIEFLLSDRCSADVVPELNVSILAN